MSGQKIVFCCRYPKLCTSFTWRTFSLFYLICCH